MKNLFLSLLILSVAFTACKKSGSDNNTPGIDGKTCKILTMSSTISSHTSFSWFYYHSSGNILYTKDLSPLGDTTIGVQYFYEGNVLKYSFYNKINLSDTVFYLFDGSGKLVNTTEHMRTGSSLTVRTTDFFYNSSNQVFHTLAQLSNDTTMVSVDSNFYTYTGKNVTTLTEFYRTGNGISTSLTINFKYDSMKNYLNAMGRPADNVVFWSENNMIEMKYADTTNYTVTYSFSKYNESGYPTEYTQTDSNHPGVIVTGVITYQCK